MLEDNIEPVVVCSTGFLSIVDFHDFDNVDSFYAHMNVEYMCTWNILHWYI